MVRYRRWRKVGDEWRGWSNKGQKPGQGYLRTEFESGLSYVKTY
jgi:hypothetical protein